MHFHAYTLAEQGNELRIEMASRFSTDSAGIAKCLDLQAEARIELEIVVKQLESKLSDRTLLKFA